MRCFRSIAIWVCSVYRPLIHQPAKFHRSILGPEAVFARRVCRDEAQMTAVFGREEDDARVGCDGRMEQGGEGNERVVVRVYDERGDAYVLNQK